MSKFRKITSLLVAGAVALLTAAAALAWYYEATSVDIKQISGQVLYVQKYFESGDGTSANQFTSGAYESEKGCAYEIATAEQFYNLAWLQYLGYFNVPDETGNIPTTYFYLSKNLDMSGYVLPPIGTQEHPFLGNFDGNGHTVSNLTVSNTIAGNSNSVTDLPLEQGDAELTGVNIIGVFGVVGELKDGDYSYDTATNEVKNLTLSGVTVSTQLPETLVGIAAGYVNGTMTDVKVVNSSIEIPQTSTALRDYTSNLSDYSLVGYCTDAYKDTVDVVKTEIAEPVLETDTYSADLGTGTAWGGSIDMMKLFTRVQGVMKSNDTTQMDDYVYERQYTKTTDSDGNEQLVIVKEETSQLRVYESTDGSSSYVFAPYDYDKSSNDSTYSDTYTYLSGGTWIKYVEPGLVTERLDGYKIRYGNNGNNNYMSLDLNLQALTATNNDNATVWFIEDNNKLYTIIDDQKYYLNHGAEDEPLTVSQNSNNSTWTTQRNYNRCLYYPYDVEVTNWWGTSTETHYFYLTLENGAWTLKETDRERNVSNLRFDPAYIEITYEGFVPKTNEQHDSIDYDDREPKQSTVPVHVTYFPLSTSNNTGYVISGSSDPYTSRTFPTRSGDIRISKYAKRTNLSDIVTVYTIGKGGETTFNAEEERNAQNKTYVKFSDSYNGFEDVYNSDDYVYGLHFMKSTISKANVVYPKNAIIDGKKVFDLPTDCIDFSLREKGYINFFAGTYFEDNNSFFSLHRIVRDGSNIHAILQINQIYQGDDGSYIYNTSGGYFKTQEDENGDPEFVQVELAEPPTSDQLLFDMAWIGQNDLEPDKLYYFEIPVDAGEYALGSVDGGIGAYLLYLDISANAQMVENNTVRETEITTAGAYEFPKGVNFGADGADGGDAAVTLSLPAGTRGTVTCDLSGQNFNVSTNGTANTLPSGASATYIRDGIDVPEGLTASPVHQTVVKNWRTTVNERNTSTGWVKQSVFSAMATDTYANGEWKKGDPVPGQTAYIKATPTSDPVPTTEYYQKGENQDIAITIPTSSDEIVIGTLLADFYYTYPGDSIYNSAGNYANLVFEKSNLSITTGENLSNYSARYDIDLSYSAEFSLKARKSGSSLITATGTDITLLPVYLNGNELTATDAYTGLTIPADSTANQNEYLVTFNAMAIPGISYTVIGTQADIPYGPTPLQSYPTAIMEFEEITLRELPPVIGRFTSAAVFAPQGVQVSQPAYDLPLDASVNVYADALTLAPGGGLGDPSGCAGMSVYDLAMPYSVPLIFVQQNETILNDSQIIFQYTAPDGGGLGFDLGGGMVVPLEALPGAYVSSEDGIHFTAVLPASPDNLRVASFCTIDSNAIIGGSAAMNPGVSTLDLLPVEDMPEEDAPMEDIPEEDAPMEDIPEEDPPVDEGMLLDPDGTSEDGGGAFILIPTAQGGAVTVESVTLCSITQPIGMIEYRMAGGGTAYPGMSVYYTQAPGESVPLELFQEESGITLVTDVPERIQVVSDLPYTVTTQRPEPEPPLPDFITELKTAFVPETADLSAAAETLSKNRYLAVCPEAPMLTDSIVLDAASAWALQPISQLPILQPTALICLRQDAPYLKNSAIKLSFTLPEGSAGTIAFVAADGQLVTASALVGASVETPDGIHYTLSIPATLENLEQLRYCVVDSGGVIQPPPIEAAAENPDSTAETPVPQIAEAPVPLTEEAPVPQTEEAPADTGSFVLIPTCQGGSIRLDSVSLIFPGEPMGTIECRNIGGPDFSVAYTQAAGAPMHLLISRTAEGVLLESDDPAQLTVSTALPYRLVSPDGEVFAEVGTEPTDPTEESTEPTDPTDESTEPTDPTDESTEPTDPTEESMEPTDPTDESTEPTDPTDESTEPTDPTDESTEPTDPTDESTEPTDPTDESTEPTNPTDESTEPTNPTDESTEPTDPTDESTEPTDPTDESTEPTDPTEESTEPTEPTDESTEPTNPTDESTEPTDPTEESTEPTDPTDESTEPTNPTDESTEPTDPTEESTEPTDPTEESTEPTDPTDESTEPTDPTDESTEPTDPTDESTEPTDPTEESTEPTDPTDESTEPTNPTDESTEPTDPTEESTEPTDPTDESTEPTDPTDESTEPTDESTEPTDPTEESTEPTDPTEESTEPTDPTEESTEPTDPTDESTEPTDTTEESTEPEEEIPTLPHNYNTRRMYIFGMAPGIVTSPVLYQNTDCTMYFFDTQLTLENSPYASTGYVGASIYNLNLGYRTALIRLQNRPANLKAGTIVFEYASIDGGALGFNLGDGVIQPLSGLENVSITTEDNIHYTVRIPTTPFNAARMAYCTMDENGLLIREGTPASFVIAPTAVGGSIQVNRVTLDFVNDPNGQADLFAASGEMVFNALSIYRTQPPGQSTEFELFFTEEKLYIISAYPDSLMIQSSLSYESVDALPEPTDPTDESTEPTDPTDESTEPTDPTDESTEPTDPTDESTEPTDPTDESTEPTGPTDESTEPTDPTEAPPTEAPPTEAPPTEAPPTEAPPTEAPPTEAPPTEAPPTEAPPTEAPPTEAPPTEAPPMEAPPTEAPPTEAPPTEAPPTEAPPTEAPPTEAPPTEAPPTEAPPTEAPPTEAPPTEAPPTEAPPTEAPPTEAA